MRTRLCLLASAIISNQTHVRKLLNTLLRPVGYKIERISPFSTQLARLARLHKIKFAQIGANDGVRFDDLYGFVTNRSCEGIVVEPLPDVFTRLAANYLDHPSIKPVNKAVHATQARLTIYRVSPDASRQYPGWAAGIASFDREHLLRHNIRENDIKCEEVTCVPLMQLLAEHDLLDLHLLQIDTEGYDAEIVRMIDFNLCSPVVIKYEHKQLNPTSRSELENILKEKGYRVVREAGDTIAWR